MVTSASVYIHTQPLFLSQVMTKLVKNKTILFNWKRMRIQRMRNRALNIITRDCHPSDLTAYKETPQQGAYICAYALTKLITTGIRNSRATIGRFAGSAVIYSTKVSRFSPILRRWKRECTVKVAAQRYTYTLKHYADFEHRIGTKPPRPAVL